jgi:hypothetical protein
MLFSRAYSIMNLDNNTVVWHLFFISCLNFFKNTSLPALPEYFYSFCLCSTGYFNCNRKLITHIWLIDWCLTPTLAIFQLYSGANKFYY